MTANAATASESTRIAIPTQLVPSSLARPSGRIHALGGETMGTSWSVRYVDRLQREPVLRAAIAQALGRVIADFSPWESASALRRFNDGPVDRWQEITPDFAKVLGAALQVAGETAGAYDPAFGALVDLWGFGPQPPRESIPSAAAIADALNHSGYRQIVLDAAARRISRFRPARLDLCGIAKGFAVDLVAETLRRNGVPSALVEIGGELAGYGVKPDGTPWWVSVDRGDSAGKPILVALHDLSIATSGCERSFRLHDVQGGAETYSHTIDPRSGRPIDNGMAIATVLHRSCMMADAYATALMVMGPGEALAFADEHGLAAVIEFDDRENRTARRCERMSKAFEAMIG